MSHARETLAGLYYDTAVSSLAPTVAAVKELAGAGRIVYGTDFPAGPEPVNYLSTRLLARERPDRGRAPSGGAPERGRALRAARSRGITHLGSGLCLSSRTQ